MKTYKLLITITEGYDEYWEELKTKGKPGCDEIIESLREALRNDGFLNCYETTIKLIEFTDKE